MSRIKHGLGSSVWNLITCIFNKHTEIAQNPNSRRVASHDYVGFCFETFNKPWFITCTSLGWHLSSYLSQLHKVHLIPFPLHNYQWLVAKLEGDLLALTEITASGMLEVGPHDCHRHQVHVLRALDLDVPPARLVLLADGAQNHQDAIYPMTMKMSILMKNATPRLKSKL